MFKRFLYGTDDGVISTSVYHFGDDAHEFRCNLKLVLCLIARSSLESEKDTMDMFFDEILMLLNETKSLRRSGVDFGPFIKVIFDFEKCAFDKDFLIFK